MMFVKFLKIIGKFPTFYLEFIKATYGRKKYYDG